MNATERYLFDLNGFLVIEDLLSAEEVAALNRRLDEYDLWAQDGSREHFDEYWSYGDNYKIVGPSHEWDHAFRQAIAHPSLLPYLKEIVGETVRYDHGQVIVMTQGAGALGLHGGGTPWAPSEYYHWHDGQMFNGMVVASVALVDMSADNGGFVCLPGSHKANLACPREFLAFEENSPTLFRASLRAGSAVIFTEALTHGTFPWSGEHERRALLMKYCPGHMAYQASYPTSADVGEDLWGSTPRELFEAPYTYDRAGDKRAIA